MTGVLITSFQLWPDLAKEDKEYAAQNATIQQGRTSMTDKSRTVSMVGVNCDAGASKRGANMGAEALRVAGLQQVLGRLGVKVEDIGNIAGPRNPMDAPSDGYRHLAEVTQWNRKLHSTVYDTLCADKFPLIMGGDHSLAIGSISAVARKCAEDDIPLSVLWLDAHTDFNTPATSPSGNIHGMPVAVLCGDGPKELLDICHTTPAMQPTDFFQVGIRSVDHVEKEMISKSGMKVYDMRTIDERRMRPVMNDVLKEISARGGHLHVSFDVDFLDPSIAPGTGTKVPGGPTYREAQLCMEMIHDCGLLRSLDVVEVNPAEDIENSTAKLAVELIASLFGEQILARHDKEFLKD